MKVNGHGNLARQQAVEQTDPLMVVQGVLEAEQVSAPAGIQRDSLGFLDIEIFTQRSEF